MEILNFKGPLSDLIYILKKGGSIHIKKKNRGKFTEYCGGKVTEKCIAKGKKSKDPKIRKRATFAANARKWKHENGGIIKYQNPSSPLINRVNKSKANFVQRLLDPNRKHIQNWVNPLSISTHKLGWATEDTKQGAFVYPEVQEINGELVDFTNPIYRRSEGINSAVERRDTVRMTPEQAKWFTENYKQYYPGFKDGGILKAQEGTGNLYAPQPLSPVGIALNQAKATAKMKGEQQYLPPGVREVVGPDGKKVAIRTEQPLIPLEQSIAEWLPGTGDVAEVGYIANDVKNGNYGTAALAAGLMVIPGNAGKLLSKHRKAVSKTADTIEDVVRKADVSEYINTVDDVLPERQLLTINKSKQFWDGTSKSKLTDAEKAGISKGERNQPVKVGYRSEFPNDRVINAEHLKNEMIDLFNSPVYRDRLIKAGYSDAQIDDFLKNRMQLGAVRKAPIAISSDVELGDAAHWYRNYVKINPNAKDINEEVFHELGHGSDFPGLYQDPRQPKITKLAFPGSKYYLNPSEIRTRGLGVLQWMQKHGKTIDDFYKPGNTDLNKRAQEFLIYYPEDQGRQYLSSFWKQGGKINVG